MIKQPELPLGHIKPLLLPALFIYLFVLFLLPEFCHPYDSSCWANWASQLQEQGFVSAYDKTSDINYLPLYLYILKGFSYLITDGQFYPNVYRLKAITWMFDIMSILLLCSMVKLESKRLRYFIFGILNVGFFYNTIIWSQVDGILACFVFSSFYFAYYKRAFLSIILFILGLNFKLQAIIYAPVLLVLWLPELKVKTLILFVFAALLLQCIIILPFVINGNAKNIWLVAFNSVDNSKVVSMNAFNLWYLFLKGNLMEIPDNLPILFGYTWRSIGLGLFCFFSTMVCLPLYLNVYKARILKHAVSFDLKLLLLSMTLMCYVFFFFNTQMHERYIHPAIIFLTALAFIFNKKLYWVIWLLVSLNYACSLEYVCDYLLLDKYKLMVFTPPFIAKVYTLGLMLLLYVWYKALPPKAFYFKKVE